jgi:hypothetical protein
MVVAVLGMGAAFFGFAGAIVILYATLRTVRLRKAIVEGFTVKTDDANIKAGVALLLGKLNEEQLRKLHHEHWLSIGGAALLAIGFIFGFVRELF